MCECLPASFCVCVPCASVYVRELAIKWHVHVREIVCELLGMDMCIVMLLVSVAEAGLIVRLDPFWYVLIYFFLGGGNACVWLLACFVNSLCKCSAPLQRREMQAKRGKGNAIEIRKNSCLCRIAGFLHFEGTDSNRSRVLTGSVFLSPLRWPQCPVGRVASVQSHLAMHRAVAAEVEKRTTTTTTDSPLPSRGQVGSSDVVKWADQDEGDHRHSPIIGGLPVKSGTPTAATTFPSHEEGRSDAPDLSSRFG